MAKYPKGAKAEAGALRYATLPSSAIFQYPPASDISNIIEACLRELTVKISP